MTSTGDDMADPRLDFAWLVSLARRLAQPGEDADDLAQETWLVALQHQGAPRGASRSWLAGVLRNVGRMRARTRVRRIARERDHVVEPPANPESAMAEVETLEALRAALGALDPVDRTLVLGRYATGQTAVALGEHLGMPASTVRTRLARAKEQLRDDVRAVRGAGCFAPWILRPADVVGASGILAGGVVMGTATKLGLSVAAIALVAVGTQRILAAPSESAASVVQAPTDATTPNTVPEAPARAEDERRAAMERKLDRILARREQRLAARGSPPEPTAPTAVVSDECDDGCVGTLELHGALARAVSDCRELLPATARGKTKFHAHVIAELYVGAVVDGVDVVDDTLAVPEFTECIVQSAPMAELRDAEHPIADRVAFRFVVGMPSDPAGEFLAAHPELLTGHPELAALAARGPDEPLTDVDATAFARWVDQDPQAQAAFGRWAADEGIDLARFRAD